MEEPCPPRGGLEWLTQAMPPNSAPPAQGQRVGMTSPSGQSAFGSAVLAVRVKKGLNCLSGQPRPVDQTRLARNRLQPTGDRVADRMLDVATTEIEAGNAGANELGIIGDILKGLFTTQATGVQQASQKHDPPPGVGDQSASLKDVLKWFDFSSSGSGDVESWWSFSRDSDLEDLQKEAQNVTRNTFGHNGHNDASDAFRHAYWSFRMAQTKGTYAAKKIGDGHERRPVSSYKGFSLNNQNQPPSELLMDLFNNNMGRLLFTESKDGKDIPPDRVKDIILRAQSANRLQGKPFPVKRR